MKCDFSIFFDIVMISYISLPTAAQSHTLPTKAKLYPQTHTPLLARLLNLESRVEYLGRFAASRLGRKGDLLRSRVGRWRPDDGDAGVAHATTDSELDERALSADSGSVPAPSAAGGANGTSEGAGGAPPIGGCRLS